MSWEIRESYTGSKPSGQIIIEFPDGFRMLSIVGDNITGQQIKGTFQGSPIWVAFILFFSSNNNFLCSISFNFSFILLFCFRSPSIS